MNLANKRFKNNMTGEVVTVIDSFEHIAILENRQKIDVGTLLNKSLYSEEIYNSSLILENKTQQINNDLVDPSIFFGSQNSYDSLASKIKKIDTSGMSDDNPNVSNILSNSPISEYNVSDESAIIYSNEDDERAELIKKYGAIDTQSQTNKQNEAFAEILGDDSELPTTMKMPEYGADGSIQEKIERIEVNRDTPTQQMSQMRIVDEDPIIKMFKGVKRSVDFKMSINLNNKIPRLDFIEMMEDSYESSIIDFLSDEFTNNLVKNPNILKDHIKSEIMKKVYGDVKNNEEISKTNDLLDNNSKKLNDKPKRRYTKKVKINND